MAHRSVLDSDFAADCAERADEYDQANQHTVFDEDESAGVSCGPAFAASQPSVITNVEHQLCNNEQTVDDDQPRSPTDESHDTNQQSDLEDNESAGVSCTPTVTEVELCTTASGTVQQFCRDEQTVVEQLRQQLSQCTEDLSKFRKNRDISKVELWTSCPEKVVEKLPYDIDGLQKYVIKCSKQDMMKVSVDGRPWKTWFTTTRKGFHGTRRRANCQGSSICKSETCPFYQEHGAANRVQFRKQDGQYVCFSCELLAEHIPCPAVKVWEYHDSVQSVFVYHVGIHTCVCKPQMPNLQELQEEVRRHPRLTPVQVSNLQLVDYLARDDDEFKWEELDGIMDNVVDTHRLQYARQKRRQQDEPYGVNFDALSLLKTRCDKQDKFLMYRLNSRTMSNSASFVFKSSKHMAELALSMDRDRKKFLSEEYAFIDVKHNRCRDFKAVTLWTYHPAMRKLMRLAVMDVEEENTENLTSFWLIFNEMLQEVSGDNNYLFNPRGFISDEHHANFQAIYRVFGNDGKERIRTCEFHYMQTVQRHAKYLDPVSGEEFKQLAEQMLKAPSHKELETACALMCSFSNDHSEIKPWFQWWYKRKNHVCRAYKPIETPHSNLAEVGHSKMASVARKHMSLLDAARDDVVFALRQHKEMTKFTQGGHTGGTGVSVKSKRARCYRESMRKAAAYAGELDLAAASDNEGTYLPLSGTHRPPKRRKLAKKVSHSQPSNPRPVVASNVHVGSRLRMRLRTMRRRNVRLRSPGTGSAAEEDATTSGNHACIDAGTQAISRPASSSSTSTVKASSAVQSRQPKDRHLGYHLWIKRPAIRSCYGCKQSFAQCYSQPPKDLIVRRFMQRRYIDKKTGLMKTSPIVSATYFHLNLNCLRKVSPRINASDVFVHEEVWQHLTEERLARLRSFGLDPLPDVEDDDF